MIKRVDVANEANIGITICTFLGTVGLFFTGLIISQLNNFSQSIKVGVLYLIASTFGLIFSSIIYSNAAGEVNTDELSSEFKFVEIGNSISEFLGIYPFIVAIPIVINGLTPDPFLRITTFLMTFACLVAYTISRFSLMARSSTVRVRVIVAMIVGIFLILLNFGQTYSLMFFEAVSLIFLAFLAILAYVYRHKT